MGRKGDIGTGLYGRARAQTSIAEQPLDAVWYPVTISLLYLVESIAPQFILFFLSGRLQAKHTFTSALCMSDRAFNRCAP